MMLRSTTLRFAALVFLLQCVSAAALLACVHQVVRDDVYAGARQTVELLRQDLLAVRAADGAAALQQAVALRSDGDAAASDAVLLLVDRAGGVLAGNLTAWPSGVAAGEDARVTLHRRGHVTAEAMLVRATRLPGGARLLTGSVVEDEAHTIRLVEVTITVALLLAIGFAALAAWLVARMIAARLVRTVGMLEAVRAGDLSRRAEDTGGSDAFDMLGASINAMLDRIQRLVEELTLGTDMLAHDLRSPLTRLNAALERAAMRVDTPAAQDEVARALGEAARLMQMVETALRITRTEAGIGRDAFVPTDVMEQLCDVADIYGPVAEDVGRSIVVRAGPTLTLPLHRELIAQSLSNLVDNALKHGAGAITLALEVRDDHALISVADEGGGIAPEHRATAIRRFGRIDEARSGSGAGLGLSLVAATARLHGGEIRLENDRGLRAILALPVHSAGAVRWQPADDMRLQTQVRDEQTSVQQVFRYRETGSFRTQ